MDSLIKRIIAKETEQRDTLIEKSVDMYDLVLEVGLQIKERNRQPAGENRSMPFDLSEAYELVGLALKAEEVNLLSRIEGAIKNM